MLVSANEILQTCRKAALASGLSHDRAIDIGQSIVWLEQQGQKGCQALKKMLAEADTNLPLNIKSETTKLTITQHRPAMEGIAATDWLIANPQKSIHIKKLTHGLILAGILGTTAKHSNQTFQAKSQNKTTTITATNNTNWQLWTEPKEIEITQTKQNPKKPLPQKPLNPLNIDPKIWQKLLAQAQKTYVPSSEKSRKSGAGAGLTDND